MNIRKSKFIIALLLCVFCIVAHASDSDLTPAPGDPLRKQVLDALRKEVKLIQGIDVVFVVRHLKVKDGWAWVHALPQSPDGKNRYEDISALLQLENDNWKVVEIPCSEIDNPECIEGAGYYKQLHERYPDFSIELLPVFAVPNHE